MVLLPMLLALSHAQIDFDKARHEVRGFNTGQVRLTVQENGGVYRSRLTNRGTPAKIDEVVILDIPISMPSDTPLYGEGFTMLSQTGGTLGHPINIGAYTDHEHYRMPVPDGATTVYNILTLSPWAQPVVLLGFTTCRRFSGHFNVFPDRVQVVVDTEGLTLSKGESWDLEDLSIKIGENRQSMLAQFGSLLAKSAGKLRFKKPPAGW